jgi:putative glutamine amidotransferase
MTFRVGILPRIFTINKINYFSVDFHLINFIKKIKTNIKIFILYDKKYLNLDLIISSGGNDILKFSKKSKNKIRHSLDIFYLQYAIKKDISFLGICYGAQFIASYFDSSLIKINKHTNTTHKIFFSKNKKSFLVNSYHQYAIKKLGKKLKEFCYCEDKTIEGFSHINKKISGIMWHPERLRKSNEYDLNLIRQLI